MGSARRGDSDLAVCRRAAPPWGNGITCAAANRAIRVRVPAAAQPMVRLTGAFGRDRLNVRLAAERVVRPHGLSGAPSDRGSGFLALPGHLFSRALLLTHAHGPHPVPLIPGPHPL